MIVLIVAGLALAAVGLIQVTRAGLRLYRKVGQVQKQIEAQLAVIMKKQEEIMERVASIEQNQLVLADRMERMKQATGRLGYLLRQWSEAQERFLKVP
jgi:hypothetical protein